MQQFPYCPDYALFLFLKVKLDLKRIFNGNHKTKQQLIDKNDFPKL